MTEANATPADEVKAKAHYLTGQIEKRANRIHQRVRYYQVRHFATSLAIVVLGSCVTAIGALKGTALLSEKLADALIVVFGVLITVLTAWYRLLAARSIWLSYLDTLRAIRRLQSELNLYLAGRDPARIEIKKLEDIHSRFQDILEQHEQRSQEAKGRGEGGSG